MKRFSCMSESVEKVLRGAALVLTGMVTTVAHGATTYGTQTIDSVVNATETAVSVNANATLSLKGHSQFPAARLTLNAGAVLTPATGETSAEMTTKELAVGNNAKIGEGVTLNSDFVSETNNGKTFIVEGKFKTVNGTSTYYVNNSVSYLKGNNKGEITINGISVRNTTSRFIGLRLNLRGKGLTNGSIVDRQWGGYYFEDVCIGFWGQDTQWNRNPEGGDATTFANTVTFDTLDAVDGVTARTFTYKSNSRQPTGTGKVVKRNAGTAIFQFSPAWTGGTEVQGGTLRFTPGTVTHQGAVTLTGGTLEHPSATHITVAGNMTFAGGTLAAILGTPVTVAGTTTVTAPSTIKLSLPTGFISSGPHVLVDNLAADFDASKITIDASACTGCTITCFKQGAQLMAMISGACTTSDLLHRWSFTGDYTDSVGGLTATALGSVSWNNATTPTAVKLPGGNNGTACINLGQNIVPSTSSPITLEIWTTLHAVKNWSRVFDFGADTSNYLLMTWSQGTDGAKDRVELKNGGTSIVQVDNTMQPYTANTPYHIAITMTPQSDGKTAFVWAKRDVTTGAVIKSGSGITSAAWDPSKIASFTKNYLGRSEYSGDNDASATYDEVRIWKKALTSEQLKWSAQLGPDVRPDSDAIASLSHTITLTSVNGTVSVDGAAGVGSGSVTAACKPDLRLVATPAEGYTFYRWEIDEQYITSGTLTSSEITINLPRDIAVTAVFADVVPKFARYANGEFSYFNISKGATDAPAGGMNNDITILFSNDADYQALKTIPTEVAKAKGLELEANVTLTNDTDWTQYDYSLGGNAIDINGHHFTTGSLAGEGGITSDGNMIANGDFQANTIADGASVEMVPNGWKTSGSVGLIKNNNDFGSYVKNGSNLCRVDGYIYREFTIVQAGDYQLKFDMCSKSYGGYWANNTGYCEIDSTSLFRANGLGWTFSGKSFIVPLGVGTHTLKIGGSGVVLVDNVRLYKTSTSTTPGILEVKVPEGKTLTNETVALGGGAALQLWKTGAGTLVMNKENKGYGSPNGYVATVVKEGLMYKPTTTDIATCGAQYATIQVDSGATFDIKGRSYWDYDYLLSGTGLGGTGALINTVSATDVWKSGAYGYLRNVSLGGDTIISGTQSFGMSTLNHGATTMTMNDHTVHYAGTTIYLANMSYVGKGRIVIDEGATVQAFNNNPTASGTTVEVKGQLQQHAAVLSPISNLLFTATGSFYNGWSEKPAFTVLDTYAPNLNIGPGSTATYPTVTLGAADSLYTTLDLSLFTDTFDGSSTTFFANTQVTVEFGTRTLTDGQKVVSWSAIPAVGGFFASGENIGGASLVAREDGLYVQNMPAYAEWDVSNERWNYFTGTGAPYPGMWEGGVTGDMEVRFDSISEYNAIQAQGVSPHRYVMTGLAVDEGASSQDFTTGFNFSIQPNMVIDLKGHRVKFPISHVTGVVPFTVTDTTCAPTATGGVPSILNNACFWLDAFDTSTMNIDGNGKVQTWTSKDANHVVATAASGLAPTYKASNYCIPTVDFGAIGSGLDMTYSRFTSLQTVFWVMQIANDYRAFFLGDVDNSTYNFHRGGSGQYGSTAHHKYASMWKGMTAVTINNDIPPDNEFCVYSATMSIKAASNSLTNDRKIDGRSGGRQLSELICFDTTLSDAERKEVVQYLQSKWFRGGSFVVDVPNGETIAPANVTITGNARLVKAGEGTYNANKAGLSYTGGTEIEGGKMVVGNNTCFGATGSEVQVNEGATLEVNGKGDMCNYAYLLNGGTMQNTVSDLSESTAQISNVRLLADSTFKPSNSWGLIGPGYAATKLDLGGHKLTVPVGVGKSFWMFNTTVTEGTIDITSGGWLKVDKATLNAPDTTLRINCALNFQQPVIVGGYETHYGNPAYNEGTGLMTVNKLFKPCSTCYRGLTLANGATIDLTEFDGTLTGTSAFTAGANTITYPSGTAEAPATLYVELDKGNHGKVIGWETVPANLTFERTEGTKARGIQIRRHQNPDDGVYVTRGTIIFMR